MENSLWTAIEGLTRGEDSARERFLLLTEISMAALFPDDAELLAAYRTLLPRLYVLRARDDFWAWVQLQFPDRHAGPDREISQDLRATLLDNLKGLSVTPPTAASLRLLPVRLIGNLWLPLMAWSMAAYLLVETETARDLVAAFDLQLKTFEGLFLVLTFGFAWSTLLSFLFSPFLGRWRRIARSRHPLLASVTLVLGILSVTTGLRWAGEVLWWSQPQLMTSYYELGHPLELLLAPLRLNLFALTSVVALVSLLVPVSLFWPACAHYKKRSWSDFRTPHKGRVAVSALLLLPLLVAPWEFSQAVWYGWELRPEIQTILETPKVEKPRTVSPLAERFLETPPYTAERWLEMGEEIWQAEEWWSHPEFETYCDAYRQVDGHWFDRSQVGVEAAVRATLLSRNGDWYLHALIEEVKLNEQEWKKIEELLTDTVIVNYRKATSYSYDNVFREVAGQGEPWGSFRYFQLQAFANQAWRALQESPEIYHQKRLLRLNEAQQAQAIDDGGDVLLVFRAMEEAKCRRASVRLIGAIIQREIAAKRPIPTDLRTLELPPECGSLEWYRLEVDPSRITIWYERPLIEFLPDETLTIPRP